MNLRRNAIRLMAITAVGCAASSAPAQLPGIPQGGAAASGAGSAAAAARAQAQVQQRVQAQVSQRAAAQIQAGVQAQTQARLQAESARAASIGARAAGAARQAAAAGRQRAAGGLPVNIGLGLETAAEARAGNQSARAGANARLGIHSGALPAGLSEADVAVYDNVFGRFNPLRPAPAEGSATDDPETPSPQAASPAADAAPPSESDSGDNAAPPSDSDGGDDTAAAAEPNPFTTLDGHLELAARIQVAAQQRRAEIAELRDHALATSNAQLMLHADQMERTLQYFLEARQQAAASGQAASDGRPQPQPPSAPALDVQSRTEANGQGMIQAASSPRTATRPTFDAQGQGQASGTTTAGTQQQ